MNEAALVRRLVRDLTSALPGVVIYKHNDLSTAGIPDLSVNFRFRTTWLEAKIFQAPSPPLSTIKKKIDKLQLAQLLRLSTQAEAYYVIGFNDAGLMILRPCRVHEVRLGRAWSWDYYNPWDESITWLAERIKR